MGLIPAPLVDVLALTGVQVKMLKELSDLYEGKFFEALVALGQKVAEQQAQIEQLLKGLQAGPPAPVSASAGDGQESCPSAVDDSPPMPANQLLNQVMIEESFDRFSKQTSLDSSVSVGDGVFSIGATSSHTNQMRTAEEAYYAVRSSFIPLWSGYLSDSTIALDESNDFDIPVPFRHENRVAYDRFFDTFGSFNLRTHSVDEGYPDLIQKRWHGVTFDRIDAAIYWGNGKVYFFREDQHIRYDLVTRRADPGYPKHIIGNDVEDWRFFD